MKIEFIEKPAWIDLHPITEKINAAVKKDLILIFKGSYLLQRKIDNPSIVINGVADFHQKSDDLICYNESGLYSLNQNKYKFSQRRYFAFDAQHLKVLTTEKTTLHKVKLADLKPPFFAFSHSHRCKNDNYFLQFCVKGKEIIIKYEVRGPSKHYNIDTNLMAI